MDWTADGQRAALVGAVALAEPIDDYWHRGGCRKAGDGSCAATELKGRHPSGADSRTVAAGASPEGGVTLRVLLCEKSTMP